MFRQKLVLLLGSVAVLPMVACGGSASTSSTTSAAPARTGVAARAPAATSAGSAGAAGSASKPAADATLPAATVPEGPRVQRNATMVLQVANGRFDRALNDVVTVVEAAGGYISGQSAQADDAGQPLRSGQVTFQVPADKFEGVLRSVGTKGTVQNITVSGNDVSQQYVDLQARLRNAEAQRNAMLALMQQARSVNDIIQVQNQLGQITSQIEQLKGQIDYLDHTTSYGTMAVTIREAAVASPHDEWGLQSAASQGLHNFTGMIAFLIVAIATLAPLLLVAAAAFVGARIAWRRLVPRPSRAS
jgi:Domain of unknown function (DUF4349)